MFANWSYGVGTMDGEKKNTIVNQRNLAMVFAGGFPPVPSNARGDSISTSTLFHKSDIISIQ